MRKVILFVGLLGTCGCSNQRPARTPPSRVECQDQTTQTQELRQYRTDLLRALNIVRPALEELRWYKTHPGQEPDDQVRAWDKLLDEAARQ